MNKKEISELRSRLQLDKNAISCIRGCYVNDKREVVSVFDYSLMSLPQEEAEKYLALFKRTLAGVPAKNLIDVDFSVDQVMDSEEHRLLMEMRNTALKDEIVCGFCEACKTLGVRCIQLEEIDKENGHPTELGMAQIASQVASALQ